MGLSKSETRAKLIDPAIRARGWTDDLFCREVGYLAACKTQKRRLNLDDTGISTEDILARNPIDAHRRAYFCRNLEAAL